MQVKPLKSLPIALIVLVLVTAGPVLLPSITGSLHESGDRVATIGDPAALQATDARWKQDRLPRKESTELVLPLHYSKGLSAKFTTARGLAKLDLGSGVFAATITGVRARSRDDVWRVDNRPSPGTSVKPQSSDRMIRLGTLRGSGGSRRLVVTLDQEAMRGFEIDLVVITPGTRQPAQADPLVGSRTLFQRAYC